MLDCSIIYTARLGIFESNILQLRTLSIENMIYKANYCCECGEKIERISDSLLNRSKFCDVCSPHFKTESYFKRAVLGAGMLGTMFGVGSFLQKSSQTQLSVQKNEIVSVVAKPQLPTNLRIENKQIDNVKVAVNLKNETNQANQTFLNKETVANKKNQLSEKEALVETVYFCGAKTKKGNGCSRKVKSPIRCWQHEGEAAVLPQNKLIASQ